MQLKLKHSDDLHFIGLWTQTHDIKVRNFEIRKNYKYGSTMSGMVLIADFLLIYQIYSINVCEGCVESSKRFVLDGTQDSNSKMHMLEERIQELVTELGQVETQLRTQHQSLQSSIDHLTRTTQQQASTISSLTTQLHNFKSGNLNIYNFQKSFKCFLNVLV